MLPFRVFATSAVFPAKSFDGRGNYNMGVREQIIFPEIEYDKIDALRVKEYHHHHDRKTDEEARPPSCCV